MRRQLHGASEIERALQAGIEIAVVLVCDAARSREHASLLERLTARGATIHFESERELRRMSAQSPAPEMIALVGSAQAIRPSLTDLMTAPGIVFILAGLRYPANVGFILRSIEVAGGAAVVLDADWGPEPFEEALRVSMRADRFYPVLREPAIDAARAARAAGRKVIAVETSGDATPWETDLAAPCAVVVGSETTGIEDAVLAEADATLRIPVAGFIPSYNVQAAVSMVLGEWLRQSTSRT